MIPYRQFILVAAALFIVNPIRKKTAFAFTPVRSTPRTFAPLSTAPVSQSKSSSRSVLFAHHENENDSDRFLNYFSTKSRNDSSKNPFTEVKKAFGTAMLAVALGLGTFGTAPMPSVAADGAAIGFCLLNQCKLPLAKCILNPKCLANVICINTCNDAADETGCQIKCGDTFENDVVGEFNKCAVSDKSCVPQKPDDNSYPEPPKSNTVAKFNTNIWNGRWYITAGQNKLFDIFDCQVHFFTETSPGKFFGKLNWRIEEPDGEFFSRDALQRFVQDPDWPAHLVNHDNEYLHYKDDWYILDFEPEGNPTNTPPFALVYYRGSNDAWDGYGGAFVYTKAAKLPEELIPRLRKSVTKVNNWDWDKDFTVTDNTCKTQTKDDVILKREQFAGKVAIQTEAQLQQQLVLVRGAATNNVKAQKLFFDGEVDQVERAILNLENKVIDFEKETLNEAKAVEKKIESVEKEIEREIGIKQN